MRGESMRPTRIIYVSSRTPSMFRVRGLGAMQSLCTASATITTFTFCGSV